MMINRCLWYKVGQVQIIIFKSGFTIKMRPEQIVEKWRALIFLYPTKIEHVLLNFFFQINSVLLVTSNKMFI